MRRLAVCVSVVAAVAVAAPQAQSTGQRFLWTVTQPGAPTSYLLGSVHVLTPAYYPLSPAIERAFKDAKVLIVETDIDELSSPSTMLAVAQRAMFTDGRTLDDAIGAELYEKVAARAKRAGFPEPAIRRMKPWMVAVTLMMPAITGDGFSPEHGVDRHFFNRAKASGMERRALETVLYQFDRFNEMAMPLQEQLLRSVLADLEKQTSDVKTIADAWARGDTRAIEKALQGALVDSPKLYDRLLVERNRNWVAPVEQCFQSKTACFVVVGAAHLVGPDSLVNMLKAKGYQVEQQ
jgi:uncharacterized protein YbaP (TraB family)